MGLLGCNHPLLMTPYRYEVTKPTEERMKELQNINCDKKDPSLQHLPSPYRPASRDRLAKCKSAPPAQGTGCSSPGACSGRIKLHNTSPLVRTSARYDFMTQKLSTGGGCTAPLPVTPNNSIMHTAYRYETRLAADQQPALPTGDFSTSLNDPLMSTSFRYEYAPPRPAGAVARPVPDAVHQRYTCGRFGAAPPFRRAAGVVTGH